MIFKECIKVNWHSFINIIKNPKEDHRVSWIRSTNFIESTDPETGKITIKEKVMFERHYCICGYNDDDKEARNREYQMSRVRNRH